ncbi:helix-turn-helix transcriptional regulator [Spiractinospora alimapuensis]|nr:helix-turn-helix transcriptional regulator [Spiractinospora alimapuensis]
MAQTLRELNGLTQRQLASRIGASASALCRWETGQASPKRDYVEQLDNVLKANGKLTRSWTSWTSGSSLPPWMRDAGRLVEEATAIDYLSPVLVPGLLQDLTYAQLVFREGQPLCPASEVDRLAAVRCARYESLRRSNDPWISAVFPETALTYFPEAVRRAQAKHLVSLLGTGKLQVHLVPNGSLLIGITSPLVMVRLKDGGEAASSDHLSGNFIHDQESNFDRLSELVKRAYAVALPPSQSQSILEGLANE